ncbi:MULTISPECIES: cation:proton antiporter [unclassified Herbaspirillum]|uniref:cation:proton antiporter domain-containing protein n=1 Tax=unclassified Herbaspirillum TaxID=2624150 RepID=UPI001154AD3E|nr:MULTISPECIES: cation:proton antiporter [unclassified Herbaspirillum]MBB5392288.1 CPA2 family monovalent cation:H+ antiporter-2 [Herbaspirillum sp. SJZ102]TQK05929.1 Kef-type potassium/proton antiporter (CPA2 family) [Herbaspirillum sp. SJZ130]TQK12593.1 Kef-type potassium/proton antiporter (CPA2 family) [Herbaspirillum sp. SJZ106]TWC68149.1 Kef-type potassium/proton antiporter (CPA2 family) [Herbaspirillum sp. SJZ099]
MFSGLELTLFLLAAAVLGVVAFRMMHLPPMLGYLVVGIVIGPHGLGFAEDNETTHALAEFGVVFLMFSIGLEFSLNKLSAMRHIVFGLGVAQVAATIAVTMVFGWAVAYFLPQLTSISWQAAFALGGALTMSSTAIVSKLLTERLELETEHGRRILGVLLFQDLALVPLLIVVPALAKDSGNLVVTLGWAVAKAMVVLALLLFFGHKLMRSWFKVVVKRRSQELFMLNLLLITLGAAWITEKAGLSLALGAFIAGMLISETEFKHQVEEDIKSFRDVLLGLFFITIGMLLNVHTLIEHWFLVLLLLIGPVLLKFGLIAALARLFGSSTGVALRTGLALAQAGEFGFVLLNQAGGLKLIDPLLIQVILASMVLSMLAAPFILAKSDAIVMKLSANEWMLQSLALTQLATRTMNAQKHVIIAGFGRSGQSLARLLEEEGITYHALEMDPELVQDARSGGANVSYGDAARRESLVAAGIHRAAALVVTYASTPSALKVLHHAAELAPELPVIVRSYDDADLDKLLAAGATEVVPESLEGSLMLASHALVMLGIPLRRVVHRVQDARDERYASLRGYFHGAADIDDGSEGLNVRLQSVTLIDGARAIGKTLAEIDLPGQCGAEVTMLRRGKQRVEAAQDTILLGGDIVVLRGSSENILRAEKRLLSK